MGKPVLVGPHTFNFQEATRLAIEAGAARRVADGGELARAISALLGDTAAREAMGEAGFAFAARHRGATDRVMGLLEPALARVTSAPG